MLILQWLDLWVNMNLRDVWGWILFHSNVMLVLLWHQTHIRYFGRKLHSSVLCTLQTLDQNTSDLSVLNCLWWWKPSLPLDALSLGLLIKAILTTNNLLCSLYVSSAMSDEPFNRARQPNLSPEKGFKWLLGTIHHLIYLWNWSRIKMDSKAAAMLARSNPK